MPYTKHYRIATIYQPGKYKSKSKKANKLGKTKANSVSSGFSCFVSFQLKVNVIVRCFFNAYNYRFALCELDYDWLFPLQKLQKIRSNIYIVKYM